MKKIALISVFIFVSLTTQAQDNIYSKFDKTLTANFSYNHVGNSFVFNYQKYVKRNSFYCGVKFFMNNANRWLQPNAYYYFKNGNASSFGKSIGLNAGYNFNYHFKNNDFVLGYFFFDIEYSNLRFKSLVSGFVNLDSTSTEYVSDVNVTSNGQLFDNTIGLGFKFKLTEKLNMNMQSGVGAGIYKENSHRLDWDPIGTDTTPFVRVGIGYSFH